MTILEQMTLEQVGVLCLGLFVGFLLCFGLFASGTKLKAALTVVAAAFGGAPVVFLAGAMGAKWLYPIGLVIGFIIAALSYLIVIARTVKQEGSITLTGFEVHDVYYERPYVSIPRLSFPNIKEPLGHFKVLDQRPDGFKIEITGSFTPGAVLLWRAEGKTSRY